MCYQPSTRYTCGHSRQNGKIKTCRRFKSAQQSCWTAFGAAFGPPREHCGRLENIGVILGVEPCKACLHQQAIQVRTENSRRHDTHAGSSSRRREARPSDNVVAMPQTRVRYQPPPATEKVHSAFRDRPAFTQKIDSTLGPHLPTATRKVRSNSMSQHESRHRDQAGSASHATRSSSRPPRPTRSVSGPAHERADHHRKRGPPPAVPRAEVYSTYNSPRQPPIAPLIRPDSPPGIPYPFVRHATREQMRENFRKDTPALRQEDREARKRAERDVRQLERQAEKMGKDRERTQSSRRDAMYLDKNVEKVREKALAKARAEKNKETSTTSREPRDKEHQPRPQPLDGSSARQGDAAPPVQMAAALARMFSGDDELETPQVSPVIGPSTVRAKYHNKVVAVKQPTVDQSVSPSAAPVPRREVRAKPDKYGKLPSKSTDKGKQRIKKDNKKSWLAGLRESPSIESFVCKDAREIERGS